jgi:uncharacterized protein YcaQ
MVPSEDTRVISSMVARRLAITRQRLAGVHLQASSKGIMDVMADLRYVQIDPMMIVAPSHLLVLWSRLGCYDPSLLDRLLWKERRLFEDWAQATSIVLTEDYPIFNALKKGFADGESSWAKKVRNWMEKNKSFSDYILDQLAQEGPLLSNRFEDRAIENWASTGWTAERNIDMMLFFLKAQGKIMTSKRIGNQRSWDLTEHFLPTWVSKEKLSQREVARRVTQSSLRALGVATPGQIRKHFVRGCYYELDRVLAELEAEKSIFRVEIHEERNCWPGLWYVHSEDATLLNSLEKGAWEPRTTLLSPFDNLISDRQRDEKVFGFSFRFEVYVPKSKRKYGCYVMPILHGDRFIGRIDPVMNRRTKQLMINAVFAEKDAPSSTKVALAISEAIEQLGIFLGAEEVCYSSRMPAAWRHYLTGTHKLDLRRVQLL